MTKTTTTENAAEIIENIKKFYCSNDFDDLQLTNWVIKNVASSLLEKNKQKKPKKAWFKGAFIEFVNKPAFFSITTIAEQGTYSDICLPISCYLKEEFGEDKLDRLNSIVLIDSEDINSMSKAITDDIIMWVENSDSIFVSAKSGAFINRSVSHRGE